MSTIVPIPVRVNPAPPAIGDIISPGWAFLAVMTPSKGARITMSSICWRMTSTCRSETRMSSRWRSMRASRVATSPLTWSRSA